MTDGVWLLFLSIAVGSIGLALFIYGKKQTRIPQMIAGVLLMAYPYFVGNPWVMLGVAALILAGVWVAVRMGY